MFLIGQLLIEWISMILQTLLFQIAKTASRQLVPIKNDLKNTFLHLLLAPTIVLVERLKVRTNRRCWSAVYMKENCSPLDQH